MVWIAEKKVIHHIMGMPMERVEIPVRVKFEFEVKEGAFVPESLFTKKIYNRKLLWKRYPRLNLNSLESSIDRAVKKEIFNYLRDCGYLNPYPLHNLG